MSGSATNFAATKFSVNDSAFVNDLAGGYFRITTNSSSLVLAFTNNHPPGANDSSFYCPAGGVLRIPTSALAASWSDPDGDPVALQSVDPNSSNGANNVATDGAFIYYTNMNYGADAILYTVADVRTNPPAVYRPGDTVRTASAVVNVLLPPAFTRMDPIGTSLVLEGAGGIPSSPYTVLTSTNLALPLAQWTRLATNNFDSGGAFAFTNAPSASPQFYLLELP
jgi:hypothetical protein